jgi:hypothetical protein
MRLGQLANAVIALHAQDTNPSSSPAAHMHVQEWVDRIVADDKIWDQNAFNELMTRGLQIAPRREDRLFL